MCMLELSIFNSLVDIQALHGAERAHLRFAHAETLIPLTCLLGLFLNIEGADNPISSHPATSIRIKRRCLKHSFSVFIQMCIN